MLFFNNNLNYFKTKIYCPYSTTRCRDQIYPAVKNYPPPVTLPSVLSVHTLISLLLIYIVGQGSYTISKLSAKYQFCTIHTADNTDGKVTGGG